ncbi:hypothetical protein [Halorubrum ezzemoulense]|uniref:hypothetical protein n=1 Tax=Halorubrum ezzemoulense TaxID=337243 RepID=UPI00232D189D|nr:hypothetical protein [Halorubrum ezzemoulense]MDB2243002.1 hypothetical protein [Halorubrum ezzemoulense]
MVISNTTGLVASSAFIELVGSSLIKVVRSNPVAVLIPIILGVLLLAYQVID